MPSQNFFDNESKSSAVIIEEDVLETGRAKSKFINPIVALTIIIVCVAAGVFVWLMSLPPQTPTDDFKAPSSVVNPVSTPSEETPPPPPQPEQSEQVEGSSSQATNVPQEQWYLRLVNAENPLPEDYGEQEMAAFGGGYYFDERILADLESMLDAAKEAGLKLRIESGYRGVKRQTARNSDEIAAYKKRGYSEEDAIALANMEEPPYRQCEHSLGLAVDLMDSGSKRTSIAFAQTEECKWLLEHGAEYGFVQRYPEDKVEITGMVYEPWHFRYVGKEDAQKMKEKGLCLEEYLAQSSN